MYYWDFYRDGTVQIVPADWALDLTVRRIFKDAEFKVMLHASGIHYSVLIITTPPAFEVIHNDAVRQRYINSTILKR